MFQTIDYSLKVVIPFFFDDYYFDWNYYCEIIQIQIMMIT